MFPSIDPAEVGDTGLAWLFLSYGAILYYASNLISEGSDLLLLIPSMASFVGGTVLPLLGAVPDGAILLFSGLGDIETAQETLSVGMGALAGSTIMLLTIPWTMSVLAGRVELRGPYKLPDYRGKPKLKTKGLLQGLTITGVTLTDEVHSGALVMMITCLPYLLIQIPATYYSHTSQATVDSSGKYLVSKESNWALGGFLVCIFGFLSYLALQVRTSQKGADRLRRVAVLKRKIAEDACSLSGVMSEGLHQAAKRVNTQSSQYESILTGDSMTLEERETFAEVVKDSFLRYDRDRSGSLEKPELKEVLRDLNESISDRKVDEVFNRFDSNGDGTISFDEFVSCIWCSMLERIVVGEEFDLDRLTSADIHEDADGGEDDEEEDVPETYASLSPDAQQAAIKRRSAFYLFSGTLLVCLFSDPMVEVLGELAARVGVSPFYVSFVLAPLAANASEVIASRYYAAKKTHKSITVSLTALEGAASMNNTFGLSILLGLIHFRGLAWQYTAETIAILFVQFCAGLLVMKKEVMTTLESLFVLSLFPISIAIVAGLEAIGFD